MQVPDPGREPVENLELQLHVPAPSAVPSGAMPGIGVDRLPYPRSAVGGILRQQSVQERRAAARQASNEERRLKRPRENCPVLALRIREDKKRGKHRFRSQLAARRPNGDSDASLWRLEVSAPSASMRRGSASGLASRRVAFAASAISGSGVSLVSSSSKIAPARRFAARANKSHLFPNAALEGARLIGRRGETRMNAAESKPPHRHECKLRCQEGQRGGPTVRDSDAKAADPSRFRARK
jgi:hypothetical protein